MEDFARDLLGLVYEEVKKPRTVAESWIDRYGVTGYVGIIALMLPAFGMIALGIKGRKV